MPDDIMTAQGTVRTDSKYHKQIKNKEEGDVLKILVEKVLKTDMEIRKLYKDCKYL